MSPRSLGWSADPQTPTVFAAASDDGLVSATASANRTVLRVHIHDECQAPSVEAGIVQAVNRALQKANGQPVDELMKARDSRYNEFSAVIEGLETQVARTRSRVRSRQVKN